MPVIECRDEEELKYYKTKAMKIKVVALDKMDKHPLLNPKYFNNRDKTKLGLEMNDIFNNWNDEEIDKEFNSIVNDRILASDLDYNNYPIYNLEKEKEESDETNECKKEISV